MGGVTFCCACRFFVGTDRGVDNVEDVIGRVLECRAGVPKEDDRKARHCLTKMKAEEAQQNGSALRTQPR